jgi:hypothetical protein
MDGSFQAVDVQTPRRVLPAGPRAAGDRAAANAAAQGGRHPAARWLITS